ncbi:IL-6 subfamily cytokine M17 [Genypterus blacodes]|uniref:IL-6 subfamily cytokine M17 n=1 Tax=Genypterus blacodes TaxID=154954 RepID=UPI003F769918
MTGHVKNMNFHQLMETATAFLSLLLVMAVDSTTSVTPSGNQQCGNSLQQTLKQTRLMQKESVDLIKTYKGTEEEMSEICKVSFTNVPEPNISGLEPSDRIASMYTRLQAFLPHFQRVYEQQTDFQPSANSLLIDLTAASQRSRILAVQIKGLYQSLFPNLPMPEPAGGPTSLPPPLNTFQQKVYGCAVLKNFKEFLSNVARELRTVKSQVCRRRTRMNAVF